MFLWLARVVEVVAWFLWSNSKVEAKIFPDTHQSMSFLARKGHDWRRWSNESNRNPRERETKEIKAVLCRFGNSPNFDEEQNSVRDVRTSFEVHLPWAFSLVRTRRMSFSSHRNRRPGRFREIQHCTFVASRLIRKMDRDVPPLPNATKKKTKRKEHWPGSDGVDDGRCGCVGDVLVFDGGGGRSVGAAGQRGAVAHHGGRVAGRLRADQQRRRRQHRPERPAVAGAAAHQEAGHFGRAAAPGHGQRLAGRAAQAAHPARTQIARVRLFPISLFLSLSLSLPLSLSLRIHQLWSRAHWFCLQFHQQTVASARNRACCIRLFFLCLVYFLAEFCNAVPSFFLYLQNHEVVSGLRSWNTNRWNACPPGQLNRKLWMS